MECFTLTEKDYKLIFDEKIEELEQSLPKMKEGVNCAELTLTNILDILGLRNGVYNNMMIPLAGGLGGYKSQKGWMGACGAVVGGCAAIGVILGGTERMDNDLIPIAYLKAAKFASEFENEFGSVVCSDLCGVNFSDPNGFIEYRQNNIWSKTCCRFIFWAIDEVRKLTRKQLKKKW